MNKAIWAGVGLAALAGLWSGGWYAGRALMVEPEADKLVERLRSGAVFFSYDARSVGGFPFAYDVAYRGAQVSDESALWTWSSETLSVGSGMEDGGALVVRPATESRLILQPALFGEPADAAPAVVEISGEALAITLGPDNAARLNAKSLTAAQRGAAGAISGGRLALTGLSAEARLTGADAYAGEISAGEATIAYRVSPDGVQETRSSSTIGEVQFEGALDLKGARSVADFIARSGAARASMSVASTSGEGRSQGGLSAPPVEMSYAGGGAQVELSIEEGRARYAASAADAVSTLTFAPPAPFPGGQMRVAAVKVGMEMPLTQGPPQPYALDVLVEALSLDEAIWASFDPAGGLDRTPFHLTMGLGGEAVVLTDFTGVLAPGQPPVDLSTLEIREARLTGLDAKLEATGRLEIAGDAERPDGEVTLTLTGGMGLVDRLVAAGLAPASAADVYRALALQFARPGEGEDVLISEIIARDGALTANGAPLR